MTEDRYDREGDKEFRYTEQRTRPEKYMTKETDLVE